MKNLLLGALLFLSMISFGQTSDIKYFNHVIAYEPGKSPQPAWLDSSFDFTSDENIVVIVSDIKGVFKYTENIFEGKTSNGSEYTGIELIDNDNGNKITMQIFFQYGIIRLVETSGLMLEFSNQ